MIDDEMSFNWAKVPGQGAGATFYPALHFAADNFQAATKQTTPEKCIKRGGHCWTPEYPVIVTSPPTYTEHCKHCPASRQGRPREAVAWEYPDGQP